MTPKCYTLICYKPSGIESCVDNAFLTDSDFKLLCTYDIGDIKALWIDKLLENSHITNSDVVWQFTLLRNGWISDSELDIKHQVVIEANRIIEERIFRFKKQEEERKLKEEQKQLAADFKKYKELQAKFST